MNRRGRLAALPILLALAGCALPAPGAGKSSYTPYPHEDYGLRGGGDGGGGGSGM